MKFRKEYQTYLLIVIAIIIAGYFLKHFFFNKKKKVIEGQGGASTTTYYRIAFNPTDFDSLNESTLSVRDDGALKELILTQYDASKIITDNAGIQYVRNNDIFKTVDYFINIWESILRRLIPDRLIIKEFNGEIKGLKVVAICANRLKYFKEQADTAAAAADTEAAAAAAAAAAASAFDYTAILSAANRFNNKNDVNIDAVINAAQLFTVLGQPDIGYADEVVMTTKDWTTAKADKARAAGAAAGAAGDASAISAAEYAILAADAAIAEPVNAAVDERVSAVKAAALSAAYADAYDKGLTLTSTSVLLNDNYLKVMAKDPANLKAAFITAAGLIYQSIYEIFMRLNII